jgi:biopolymer transport protein ExbD
MKIAVPQKRRGIDRITLNLASMIDVTFLLLIYFLLTTVLATPEDRLSPMLQVQREAAAGSLADFQPQIIDVRIVDGAPAYSIGGRVTRDRHGLEEILGPLPKSAGVFVQVADQVPVGYAIAAIQVARDVGFDQVTYVPAK